MAEAGNSFFRRMLRDPLGNSLLAVATMQKLGKHLPKVKPEELDDSEELILLAYKTLEKPKKKKGIPKHLYSYKNYTSVQRERWEKGDPDSMRFLANSPKSIQESYTIRDKEHLLHCLGELAVPFGKTFTTKQLKVVHYIHNNIKENVQLKKLFEENIQPELAKAILSNIEKSEYGISPWLTPGIMVRLQLPATTETYKALAKTILDTPEYNQSTGRSQPEKLSEIIDEWEKHAGQIPPYPEEPQETQPWLRSLPLELIHKTRDLPTAWIQNKEVFVRILLEAESHSTNRNTYSMRNNNVSFLDRLITNPQAKALPAALEVKELDAKIRKKIASTLAENV